MRAFIIICAMVVLGLGAYLTNSTSRLSSNVQAAATKDEQRQQLELAAAAIASSATWQDGAPMLALDSAAIACGPSAGAGCSSTSAPAVAVCPVLPTTGLQAIASLVPGGALPGALALAPDGSMKSVRVRAIGDANPVVAVLHTSTYLAEMGFAARKSAQLLNRVCDTPVRLSEPTPSERSGTRIVRLADVLQAQGGRNVKPAVEATAELNALEGNAQNDVRLVWETKSLMLFDQGAWKPLLQASTDAGGPPLTVDCLADEVRMPAGSYNGRAVAQFCMGKYEASRDPEGKVRHIAGVLPERGQTWFEAQALCGVAGRKLMSKDQWLYAASHFASVADNWSSGAVGNGKVHGGNAGAGASVVAASADDNDGFYGITPATANRRTLRTSEGAVVWDFAGNVSEWIEWDPAVEQFRTSVNPANPATYGSFVGFPSGVYGAIEVDYGGGSLFWQSVLASQALAADLKGPHWTNAGGGLLRPDPRASNPVAQNTYRGSPDGTLTPAYAGVSVGGHAEDAVASGGVYSFDIRWGRQHAGYVGFRCVRSAE